MRSIRLIITSSAICFFFVTVISQNALSENVKEPMQKWAISFSITENFTLDSHEGYGISISRKLSDYSWIRVSESFGYYRNAYPGETRYGIKNETYITYLRYVKPEQRAHFYYGLGPCLLFEYNEKERVYLDRTVTDSFKEWAVGVVGVLGVEVTTTEYLRFHAEYRVNAFYARDSSSRGYETKNFYFNAGNVMIFGLSVYF